MSSTIRTVTPRDDDHVVAAIVSSTLFERGDAEMLASLLADHHAGAGAAGQRWLVDVEDGEIASLPSFTGFVVNDETSWQARLALYRRVLGNRQGFVLGVELHGRVAGYAAVELLDGADDTFAIGSQHAEVLTLVVDSVAVTDDQHAGAGHRSTALTAPRMVATSVRWV